MSVLGWTALLVGLWCAASGLAALVVGPALRRRAAGRAAAELSAAPTIAMPRPRPGDLDPLDSGPIRMWLAELPEAPEPRRPSPSTAP